MQWTTFHHIVWVYSLPDSLPASATPLFLRVEQRSLTTSQETRWGLEKHEGGGVRIWKRQHSVAHSLVTATLRLFFPSSMASKTSSGLHTKRSVQPCGDTDSHKEAQGFVATRRQVDYTERRLFTTEAIRYCNQLMQIWNDYRIHSYGSFNTPWKHIVRGQRLIPLDTRIIKLYIDQASSFLYMYRHVTVQSTDSTLFLILALMSFTVNSSQFAGIDLWLRGWNQTGLVLLENRGENRSFSPSRRAPCFCPRARRGWFWSLHRNRKLAGVLVQNVFSLHWLRKRTI